MSDTETVLVERMGHYVNDHWSVKANWLMKQDHDCDPNIQAAAASVYGITGKEFLPGDVLRCCTCGQIWLVRHATSFRVRSIPISAFKADRLLGRPMFRWSE